MDRIQEAADKSNPTSNPSVSFDPAFKESEFDEEVQSILEEMEDEKEMDGKEEVSILQERREYYVFERPPDGRSLMCQLGDVEVSILSQS